MTITQGYVENLSARIRFQQVPQASPGQCTICGLPRSDDGFVDPQLDFEFYGSVIFCRQCIIEMGAIFGLIPPEVYEDMLGDFLLIQAKSTELENENERLMNAVQSLSSVLGSGSNISTVSSGVLSEPIPEQIPEDTEPVSESPEPTVDENSPNQFNPITSERTLTKSAGKQGLLNI